MIAEIGDRRITYVEFGCSREWAEANPRWLKGRSVEAACADAERESFRRLAAKVLVEKICAADGFEPSETELDVFRPPILKDESMLRALASEGRKVPEAVQRVYRGESVEAVYEEVVRPMNRTLEEFRQHVAMYRSLEAVERYLAKDWVANARQHYEQQARSLAMRAALRKRIEVIAATENRSLEDAAGDYLRSMMERIGVRVLDRQFQLPSAKEVFPGSAA